MCINWGLMDNGLLRPCHVCWQCKRDRIDDWCGRCIAESKVSAFTLRLTLTYGRDESYRCDHPHAHWLHYEDVQLYLKLLRKWTKGKVRFFCTGEYGEKKGRAHWHLVLFFKGELPPGIRFEERYVHKLDGKDPKKPIVLWPHGFSYWEQADAEKIRYAVKYILPDAIKGRRMSRFSSQPEIGHEYFRREALKYVGQKLPPRLKYRFPEDWKRDGSPREYRLTRAAAFKFLAAYCQNWEVCYGNKDWPQSDAVDAYQDEQARRRGGELFDNDFLVRWRLQQIERKEPWLLRDIGALGQLYPKLEERYARISRGE